MAKKNIHPEYHNITIVMTDGFKIETKSCFGKEGEIIKMEIDPKNHPAWLKDGGRFLNTKDNQVAKFNKKFGNFGSFGN